MAVAASLLQQPVPLPSNLQLGEKNMKEFETPTIETAVFECTNILNASGLDDEGFGGLLKP